MALSCGCNASIPFPALGALGPFLQGSPVFGIPEAGTAGARRPHRFTTAAAAAANPARPPG